MIFDAGEKFLNAYLRQLAKEGITKISFFTEVAQFVNKRKIPIRFYVALCDKACLRPEFLRLMKHDLNGVGIVRINENGQSKDYIRVHGEKDYGLCEAAPLEVPISTPPRPLLQKVLDHQGCRPESVDLATALDAKILKMRSRMKSVAHGKYAVYYRVHTNLVGLFPKRHFVRLEILEGKRWRKIRIKRKDQIRPATRRIRKAFSRELLG